MCQGVFLHGLDDLVVEEHKEEDGEDSHHHGVGHQVSCGIYWVPS